MVAAKKGVLKSHDGGDAATLDDYASVELEGQLYAKTVRPSTCEVLIEDGAKCTSCKNYHAILRKIYAWWSARQSEQISDTRSHVNERYMNTPKKKAKLDKMKKCVHEAESEVRKLQQKIEQLTREQGESIDSDLHGDLLGIMKDKTKDINQAYPEGSFARLFWEEQLRAATAKDPCQVRWHPLIIRWCLNLKLLSSSAYHATRTADFIKLPSERTLRDFTYFQSRPGFQLEVNQQLLKEGKLDDLPEHRKYCCLVLDEMKMKENLVYNKYTGEVIGFTNLGSINNELLSLERECNSNTKHAPIASHLLVLMVRGIFFKLEFPYAHFATEGITADLLFPIVWEGVRQLESIRLKVICITADGASPNRKFFRMHRGSDSDTLPTRRAIHLQKKRGGYILYQTPLT